MLARRQGAGLIGEIRTLSGTAATPLPVIPAAEARARGGLLREVYDDAAKDVATPDHPTFRALLGALMCGGPGASAAGWRQAEGCAQLTVRLGLEPVRVRLHAADGAAAMREVQAISPLALDVLMVLVDRFQAEDSEVRLVRGAEILAAKGCRRWGDERHALEEQIGRELMRLGRMSVGDDDEPLLSVTPVGEGRTGFVVSLRAGLRAAWDAAPTRRLSRTLLEFDHRVNRGADVLAKKLGFYLSLAGCGSRPVVRRVAKVLAAIGEEPGGGRAGRVADRFEEAVLRLQERSLFVVAYRGGREEERIKGWIRHWLDAELIARPLS